jgi:type IV secretory pathway VirB2 component (pilin)
MRTKDGVATLSDLVRSSLRLRPDRIPIGEVRGAEALDLLKAWGTGHPGGVGTIHAGTGIGALRRLEQLIQEAVVTVPRALIAETIDLVAVLSGRGSARRLAELARVEGLGPDGDYRITPANPNHRRTRMIRTTMRVRRTVATVAAAVAYVNLVLAPAAHASGSSMPWEAAASENPRVDRRAGRQDRRRHHHHRHRPGARVRRHVRRLPPLIQIVFGLSIAFAASSSFFLSFFSFGGGALV